MKITVGGKWVAKDGNGTAPVTVKEVKGSKVHYLYEGGSGFTHIVTVMDFIDFFEPELDTGDDIVIGSRWLYCGSVEVEVIDVAFVGEDDVIVTHEDKDGVLDYDTVAYFRDHYRPVFGFDNVNNPQHYTNGQVECIDAIRAALTDEEFRGFCKGNVLKYTWREKHKGGNESLEKAVWYLKQMVGE